MTFSSFLEKLLPHDHRLNGRALAALALLSLFCFLPGFFTLAPFDRDEARFAQASKQMLETGDIVDIRFQDEARHKKPVGIYWLQAASAGTWKALTGETNSIWPYRLPSLIGALLSVLLTALIGTKLFDARTGFAAGCLVATCLLLNAEARLAKTDAMLLASILGCLFILAKAFVQKAEKKLKPKDFFLFWGALALGVLIKGPIIFLVLGGLLLCLKVWKEPLSFLKKLRPVFGVPFALLLILPWFVLIALKSGGSFYSDSAGHDLFAKIWEGQNGGGSPPGMHALVLMGVFWPASLPFLLALPWIIKARHDKPVRFLLAWVIPTWVVFEITFTKLPHYVLPAYPALAILAAAWALSELKDTSTKLWRSIILTIWVLVSAGLAVVPLVLPLFLEDSFYLFAGMMGATALGFGLAAANLFAAEKNLLALSFTPLCGILLMLGLFGFALPNMEKLSPSRQMAAHITKDCAVPVATAGYNEPSLVFLAGTKTQFLDDGAKLAEAMQSSPCTLGVVDEEKNEKFLATFAQTPPKEIGKAEGFNIGNGKWVKLTLYRLTP